MKSLLSCRSTMAAARACRAHRHRRRWRDTTGGREGTGAERRGKKMRRSSRHSRASEHGEHPHHRAIPELAHPLQGESAAGDTGLAARANSRSACGWPPQQQPRPASRTCELLHGARLGLVWGQLLVTSSFAHRCSPTFAINHIRAATVGEAPNRPYICSSSSMGGLRHCVARRTTP